MRNFSHIMPMSSPFVAKSVKFWNFPVNVINFNASSNFAHPIIFLPLRCIHAYVMLNLCVFLLRLKIRWRTNEAGETNERGKCIWYKSRKTSETCLQFFCDKFLVRKKIISSFCIDWLYTRYTRFVKYQLF